MRVSVRSRILLTLLQIVLAGVILLPFFWMVSVSLKPATEPFAIPARLWPQHATLDNYITAFRPEFRTYFFNSLVVSLSTVSITVTLGLLAAYSFTRNQSKALLALMTLVVAAQMFPSSAIIIPIYRLMKSFIPTGNVRMSLVEVNDSANRNSCHVTIRTNTAVATRPGQLSGTMIKKKARIGPAPSRAAASSSSIGRRARKPRSIQIATGRVIVT